MQIVGLIKSFMVSLILRFTLQRNPQTKYETGDDRIRTGGRKNR